MYDPWGTYHPYADALRAGRELQRLGFSWCEHPMTEHRVESYVRLARDLEILLCSTEIAEGGIFTRAVLRDPHGRLRQPAGAGRHQRRRLRILERGLLGPGVRYDTTPSYLKAPCGPDGYVGVPSAPGLGHQIVWDYIDAHRLDESQAEPVAPLHPR